jgi:hypothetical protein
MKTTICLQIDLGYGPVEYFSNMAHQMELISAADGNVQKSPSNKAAVLLGASPVGRNHCGRAERTLGT